MITLAEATATPDGYQRTLCIDPAEVRLLWHCAFWDVPRSGMLSYRGEQCWFQTVAESDEDDPSFWMHHIVLRLNSDQLTEERRWHELFREKVGHHSDYDESGHALGAVHPRERWDEFYVPFRQRTVPDYSANEVLGWFEY